ATSRTSAREIPADCRVAPSGQGSQRGGIAVLLPQDAVDRARADPRVALRPALAADPRAEPGQFLLLRVRIVSGRSALRMARRRARAIGGDARRPRESMLLRSDEAG